MKEYLVTELAGKDVAGIANPGENESIFLSAAQAEHPLRLGHIRKPAEKPAESAKAPEALREPTEAKPRARGRGRRK